MIQRFIKLNILFALLFSATTVFYAQTNSPKSFIYKSDGNPDIETFIYVPEKVSGKTKILFVMSGFGRNADEYIDSWKKWAKKNNYIVVCPLFDDKNWDGSRGYNFGNIFTGNEGAGEMNPRSKWSFTIIEGIHQKVRNDYKIADEKFDIFGHSAGAQFVHRFVLFVPQAKIRTAIAANAGWFTLPDLNLKFPYGLKNPLLSLTKSDLMNWTNLHLVLMRGTDDLSREGNFRKSAEADAQGKTRFERSGFMYAKVKEFNPQTNWRLVDVPKIGHDQKGMALAAQKVLQEAK